MRAVEFWTSPAGGPGLNGTWGRDYLLSKRGNSLRVVAEVVRWGKRGARVNAISPWTAA